MRRLQLGNILATLSRLGLEDDTIVIFTNDNSGEWLSDNSPLFNRKWTVWEGGIRVPTIIRWPGKIPAGKITDQVGITMDLTASILAVTETAVPDAARLEGINLFPILQGLSPEVERTLFWRTNFGRLNQKAVRSGDWKLVVDGPHTFVFNLRKDIGERNDLAASGHGQRLFLKLSEWQTLRQRPCWNHFFKLFVMIELLFGSPRFWANA